MTDLPLRANAPIYSNAELRALRYAIAFVLTGSAAFVLAILALAPDQTVRALGPLSLSLVAAAAWLLLSRGKTRIAILVLTFGLWATVTCIVFFTGGIRGMAIIVYPQLILVLGWLIGASSAILMAALSVLATLGFVLSEYFGVLPEPPPTPAVMRWIVDSFMFVFSVILSISFVRSYQERLKQSEELANDLARRSADLNHAQSVAHIGSWTYDIVSDEMRPSAETCRIFGVPENTIGNGDAYLVRVHQDDREALISAWQKAIKTGGPFDHEHRIFVGGETRWIRQTAEFELDAEHRSLRSVGTTQDNTDRKEADIALRASEARFRMLASATFEGIVLSEKGRIVDANDQLAGMLGYPLAELIGRSVSDLVAAEDRERVMGNVRSGSESHIEHRLVRKDGSSIQVEAHGQNYYDEGHSFRLTALRDVTVRNKAEEQIRLLNTELEQRVEQRTHALKVANRELESFAYSVSHDLRAPLRAIEGFSRLIETEYAKQLDERGKDYFKRIRGGATRMGNLIDDLLNLSRIARQEMKIETVDLSALAHEAAEDLGGAEPERRVNFLITPNITVKGDIGLLRVAMQNLIGNAWKYSSKRETARIEFGVSEKEGRPAYFVRDNGAGFDMDYADKLFGAFQRLHSPGEFPGSGIGLATVKRIIFRHGGEVGAESKEDEGATFYFML